jgi:hypothetical protein
MVRAYYRVPLVAFEEHVRLEHRDRMLIFAVTGAARVGSF